MRNRAKVRVLGDGGQGRSGGGSRPIGQTLLRSVIVIVMLVSSCVVALTVASSDASAQPTPFQTSCPGLTGTTSWSGQWGFPDLQAPTESGTWSGIWTIDDQGTLSGSVNTDEVTGPLPGAVDSGTISGNVDPTCTTISWGVLFPGSPGYTVTGTQGTLTDTNNILSVNDFTYTAGFTGQPPAESGTATGTGVPIPSVVVSAAPSPAPFGTYDVQVTATGPSTSPPAPASPVTLSDGSSSCATGPLTPTTEVLQGITVGVGSGSCTIPGESQSPGATFTVDANFPGDPNVYAPSADVFEFESPMDPRRQ